MSSLNEAFFNLAPPTNMSVDQNASSEVTFITVVLAIVVAWILVALWTRAIENFSFGTLKLDGDSAWHALIVAITVTVVFLVTIWMIDQFGLVPGGLETEIEGIESDELGGGDFVQNNDRVNISTRNQVFIPKEKLF